MPKLQVFRSKSNNPFVNLAIENFLFLQHARQPDTKVLYLWRNGPSVIIGKFQNAWKECRVQKMEDDKVYLVRRPTGGGAVYQDLGNSIYSFLHARKDEPECIRTNNQIIIDALRTLDIPRVTPTGRNDLQYEDKKISGAAFKNTRETNLHHGTLLLDVDMTALSRYLTPNKAKLESKGVASVASRVINLREVNPAITHEAVCQALVHSFFDRYQNTCDIVDLDETVVQTEPIVAQTVRELENWDWRFGKNPKFSNELETRFDWGTFDVHLDVQKGVITEAVIHTDALDTRLVDIMRGALQGAAYSKAGLLQAFAKAEPEVAEPTLPQLHQFRDWVIQNLE